MTSSQDLKMRNNDPKSLNKIVTGDESWCFAYDPESKCQSVTWVVPGSPRAKELHFQKSRIKTMLIIFFDSSGIIHKEFVPPGQRVNAEYYKAVLDHLLKRIARIGLELYKSGDWFFLHDNAPFHNATLIRPFLAKINKS